MNSFSPNYFIHAANVLLLVAYSVRDILWLRLFAVGSSTTLEVGERLIERGKLPETVSVIVRGKVQVTRDGRVLGELIAGDVVGSALIFSSIPAEVDAVVLEPGRAMRWQFGTLERYLAANPETRTIMLQHVARDLA